MEKEKCQGCPIGEKINLYLEAAQNPLLASLLAEKQGIPGHPIEILKEHYRRTAETLFLGYKCGGWECKRPNERN